MEAPFGGPIGFTPKSNVDYFAFNRTGSTLVVGDVLQLDLTQSATETTNNTLGDVASGFSNMVVPAAATAGRILMVALEATVDNAKGKFRLKGIADGRVVNGSGDEGEGLTITTGAVFNATIAAGELVSAFLLDDPASDSETTVRILFDGENGFGIRHA